MLKQISSWWVERRNQHAVDEPVKISAAWAHRLKCEKTIHDDDVKHHTYSGFVTITLGNTSITIRKDFTGDDCRLSVPELKSQVEQWQKDLQELLCQDTRITMGKPF